MIIYDADIDALNNITFGRTLTEAQALGPIVTPKRYRCSHCGSGVCGVITNTIQCMCGNTQCPPSPPPTGMNVYFFLRNIFSIIFVFVVQPRNPCNPNPCKY